MSVDWVVRSAGVADIPVIAGFNRAMAMETEGRRLDEETIVRGVRRLMDRPAAGFYLVAETGGRVEASLMVTYEWTDWRDGLFWWIQSVYVSPAYRRGGGFRALFDAVIDRARADRDVRGIRLYVERDNAVARRTYEALGMGACPYILYEWEFGHDDDGADEGYNQSNGESR
ncbi:GNAT family N-acetyltransferase [bacterium]|nr:GNAT family N-acetyltransferase [candidate division CSSED10-310 bacterium]